MPAARRSSPARNLHATGILPDAHPYVYPSAADLNVLPLQAHDLAWARDLAQQCRAAGVPAFVKQLGTVWAQQQLEAITQEKPEG